MQLTAQIHQPSMKVFTVGLDDKGVKIDGPPKGEETVQPVVIAVPPSPLLAPKPVPAAKPRRSFKGLFTCFGLLVFALLVAITISEIAYHRSRDEAFFRLKWAELKQRMLGYDLMRAQMQQAQQMQLQQQQAALRSSAPLQLQQGDDAEERPPVVDERLAFSNRLRNSDRPSSTTEAPSSAEQDDGNTTPVDIRFAFLRAILDKLRERAAAAGMDGKMHVSLIEIRRPEMNEEKDANNNNNNVEDLSPDSEAFQDGFGEVAAPNPLTGRFRIGGVRPQQHNEDRMPASDFFGPRWEHPSQFLPESSPSRPWNGFGRDGDSAFFPRPWEQPPMMMMGDDDDEERRQPHMRVTHHFDASGAAPSAPSRVVTELYGAAGRRALDNMLLRGAPMMQLQQLQPSQQQGMDSPGSSFPRWESTINELPRPWLQNQQMQQQQFADAVLPPLLQQLLQQQIMQQQMQLQQAPPPPPQMMMGPYSGSGNFWSIPPVQQQPQAPAFPLPQNDDVPSASSSWGSEMGQQLGADLGSHFRDHAGEQQRPRLPFGTQEMPSSDAVEVRPVNGDSEQTRQNAPWYVPHGFEHQRPAWASAALDQEKTANDVPMIFPHPTAAERPIDAPPTVESTNKPSIALFKATQTDADSSPFLHEGEVQQAAAANAAAAASPSSRFAAGSWQRTQPSAAAAAASADDAPAIELARSRLPERDSFDDTPARPTHDDPMGPTDDDMDTSRVLFQVDEPHLTP